MREESEEDLPIPAKSSAAAGRPCKMSEFNYKELTQHVEQV